MFLAQKLGEILYKNSYSIYKPLYFAYKNIFEKNQILFFKSVIEKNNFVVDVGANIGFYTMLFSKIVSDTGKVFAFEPEKNNFQKLLLNTKFLKNVQCVNAAISDKTCTLKIYPSEFGLNVDFRTYPTKNSDSPIDTVNAYSLDDFLSLNKISKVDFIKMDIQGYEYYALIGMTNTLKNNTNIKLFMEFWPYGIQKTGIQPIQIINLLKDLNFNVYLFNNGKLLPITNIENNLSYSPDVNYHLYCSKI